MGPPGERWRRVRHLAIEGVIGVGKSSLARRLAAHWGSELLLEKAEDNPFLARFYADPAGYAFQTQLFFLFQRLKQVQPLAQPGMFSQGVVSDFMFAKDALFARLTLNDEEFRQYSLLHQQLRQQLPEPELVVWLRAPVETLLQRVGRRGIPMEQQIGADYLQRLDEAYVDFFAGYRAAPVLVLDTQALNLVDSQADFDHFLATLDALEPGQRPMAGNGAPLLL